MDFYINLWYNLSRITFKFIPEKRFISYKNIIKDPGKLEENIIYFLNSYLFFFVMKKKSIVMITKIENDSSGTKDLINLITTSECKFL